MRQFLILLVVLIGGTAALWHFERVRRNSLDDQRVEMSDTEASSPRPQQVDSVTPPFEDPGARPDPTGAEADSGSPPTENLGGMSIYKGERVQLLGSRTLLRNPRKEGEPQVSVVIGDSDALDDKGLRYDWFDLNIDSFRVAQGEILAESDQDEKNLNYSLTAKRARVAYESASIVRDALQNDLNATLYDVAVEMMTGLPFSGTTKLEAPRLIVDVAIERLTSIADDLVTFRSRNIHGSGTGFDVRMQDGFIGFERGSNVEVDLGDGRVLDVSTPSGGPLTLTDVTPREEGAEATPATSLEREGPQNVLISASNGVHAELRNRGDDSEALGFDEPLQIDAANLVMEMTIHPDGEAPTIQTVRVDGDVTMRHGRDSYRGQSARVFFENGEPVRAIIETNPSLNYILREDNGQEVGIRMTGLGPITVNLDGSSSAANPTLGFVFAGPGRIDAQARGGVITFENDARGRGVEDHSQAIILLSGGVRVETPAGVMTSSALIATYRAGEDLHAATDGSTLIIGRDAESGSEYHLRAEGGMTARLSGEAWFVDRATEVYAESYSDDPHRIRAELVTNVNVAAKTLSASGSILYESLWGRAVSDKALVRTQDAVTLIGSAEKPVQLDLVSGSQGLLDEGTDAASVRSGWLHAEEVRFDAIEVAAVRSVSSQIETFDGVWGFDSDELTLSRVVTGEAIVLPGEGSEPNVGQFTAGQFEDIFLFAAFVREVRYDTDEGNMVISADRVELEAGAARDSEQAAGGGQTALDPTRAAVLRARGRVTIDTESYGPEPDANGLPTVEQTTRLNASSAVFERLPGSGQPGERSLFKLIADKVTECRVAGQEGFLELSADQVTLDGGFGTLGKSAPGAKLDLAGFTAVAEGSVDMRYKGGLDQPLMRGRCQRLTLEDGVRGRMESARGQRVRATGVVPGSELEYKLESTVVTFTEDVLIAEAAEGADVKVDLTTAVRLESMGMVINSVLTKKLTATREGITLGGASVINGSDQVRGPFTLKVVDETFPIKDFELIKEESSKTIGPFDPVPPQEDPVAPKRSSPQELLSQPIWRPVDLEYPAFGRVIGETPPERGLISPNPFIRNAHVELDSSGVSVDAEWLDLNWIDYTLAAGRGAIRGGGSSPWTLSFAAIETTQFDDEVMFTITAPRVSYGDDSARADYISIWVDRAKWEALGKSGEDAVVAGEDASDDPQYRPNFLAEILFELQDHEYGKYLRAVYLEGGVEVIRSDNRAARGSKLYIDLPAAVAWLEDAELVYPLLSRGREVPLRIRTKRLGTDEEGSLTAENATLTTCNHDVPHFVVRTRKFKLEPRGDGRWRFGAKGNTLKFTDGVNLPLPSIGNLVLDEEFGIDGFENDAGEVTPLRDVGIARTARFGTTLGAAFRFDIGEVGEWFAERLGMDVSHLRGKWDTEGQYLSGRGPQGGLGLQLRERKPGDDPDEDFRLDAFVGGVLDTGRDRGSVRVEESERDDLRLVGHLRARYPIVRGEWVDFALGTQTDAGVQSEFYESDFLRFEQRDTFIRWRKSYGADYLAAGAQRRINSFRSQAEELPSFGAYRGERQVGTFTGLPVLWGGTFDAGYLRRREGTIGQDLFSDLPGGAALGIGNQDLLRADVRQRVSLPMQTDLAGIRVIPFAEVLGTTYSDALGDGTDPRRGALVTGVEVSTTLHKVTDNGYLNAIAPRLLLSSDIASSRSGGTIVPIDELDAPIDGTRFEAGFRGLWQRPGTFENLDVDVRAVLLSDRADGVEDTSELSTLANYITRYGDGEGQIGLRHDARYNVQDGETTYSRSAIALRPNDSFLMEIRYSQSRDIFDEELFETAGILARWKLDPKWELETRFSQDVRTNQQLLSELTVRRYAHDFVFDMTFQDRSGEGVNVSFSLVPLLGFTASRIGLLDRDR